MKELERIKKIAKQRGLSLQKVAEKAGMGVNSIYRWKTQTPRLDKLQDVADVLNVSLSDLTGEDDKKEQAKIDLADNPYLMYQGKQIDPDDLEFIKQYLDRVTKDDNN